MTETAAERKERVAATHNARQRAMVIGETKELDKLEYTDALLEQGDLYQRLMDMVQREQDQIVGSGGAFDPLSDDEMADGGRDAQRAKKARQATVDAPPAFTNNTTLANATNVRHDAGQETPVVTNSGAVALANELLERQRRKKKEQQDAAEAALNPPTKKHAAARKNDKEEVEAVDGEAEGQVKEPVIDGGGGATTEHRTRVRRENARSTNANPIFADSGVQWSSKDVFAATPPQQWFISDRVHHLPAPLPRTPLTLEDLQIPTMPGKDTAVVAETMDMWIDSVGAQVVKQRVTQLYEAVQTYCARSPLWGQLERGSGNGTFPAGHPCAGLIDASSIKSAATIQALVPSQYNRSLLDRFTCYLDFQSDAGVVLSLDESNARIAPLVRGYPRPSCESQLLHRKLMEIEYNNTTAGTLQGHIRAETRYGCNQRTLEWLGTTAYKPLGTTSIQFAHASVSDVSVVLQHAPVVERLATCANDSQQQQSQQQPSVMLMFDSLAALFMTRITGTTMWRIFDRRAEWRQTNAWSAVSGAIVARLSGLPVPLLGGEELGEVGKWWLDKSPENDPYGFRQAAARTAMMLAVADRLERNFSFRNLNDLTLLGGGQTQQLNIGMRDLIRAWCEARFQRLHQLVNLSASFMAYLFEPMMQHCVYLPLSFSHLNLNSDHDALAVVRLIIARKRNGAYNERKRKHAAAVEAAGGDPKTTPMPRKEYPKVDDPVELPLQMLASLLPVDRTLNSRRDTFDSATAINAIIPRELQESIWNSSNPSLLECCTSRSTEVLITAAYYRAYERYRDAYNLKPSWCDALPFRSVASSVGAYLAEYVVSITKTHRHRTAPASWPPLACFEDLLDAYADDFSSFDTPIGKRKHHAWIRGAERLTQLASETDSADRVIAPRAKSRRYVGDILHFLKLTPAPAKRPMMTEFLMSEPYVTSILYDVAPERMDRVKNPTDITNQLHDAVEQRIKERYVMGYKAKIVSPEDRKQYVPYRKAVLQICEELLVEYADQLVHRRGGKERTADSLYRTWHASRGIKTTICSRMFLKPVDCGVRVAATRETSTDDEHDGGDMEK